MTGPDRAVRLALSVSLLRRGDWSPGVPAPQSVAFATDDVVAAARALRAAGAPLVAVPANYHDDLDARLDLDPRAARRPAGVRAVLRRGRGTAPTCTWSPRSSARACSSRSCSGSAATTGTARSTRPSGWPPTGAERAAEPRRASDPRRACRRSRHYCRGVPPSALPPVPCCPDGAPMSALDEQTPLRRHPGTSLRAGGAAADLRRHQPPRRRQVDAHRGARAARPRDRPGRRGARQGRPPRHGVGLDGHGEGPRHLHHLGGAAVRVPATPSSTCSTPPATPTSPRTPTGCSPRSTPR